MRHITIMGAAAILATSLAACSSPGKPSANPTPVSNPTTATPTGTAPATAPAPVATGSKPTTTLDPCLLMTQQEASQLTGESFGPGKEGGGGGVAPRSCIYGAQTKNVFIVIVVQGSSVQQVQTMRNAMLAQIRSSGSGTLPLTTVPGVGDNAQAVYGTILAGNGGSLDASGIYVLKGTIAFALVDETSIGGRPSTAALAAQAKTVLGRLP